MNGIVMVKITSFALLFLLGCSSLKKEPTPPQKKVSNSTNSGENPAWILNPIDFCGSKKLCAVGEGVSLSQASASARAALARKFTSSISTDYQEMISSNGASTDQFNTEVIREITEIEIEGVETIESFETNVGFYALAAIDRNSLAKNYLDEINKLDSEIEKKVTSQNLGAKLNLKELFLARETLNQRRHFLIKKRKPSRYKYNDILDALESSNKRFALVYTSEENENIHNMLKSLFERSGLVFSQNEAKANFLINVQLTEKEEYMKVSGFEKFRFGLQLKSIDGSSQKLLGTLTTESIMSGRNRDQALEKALVALENECKEKLDKLNLK